MKSGNLGTFVCMGISFIMCGAGIVFGEESFSYGVIKRSMIVVSNLWIK